MSLGRNAVYMAVSEQEAILVVPSPGAFKGIHDRFVEIGQAPITLLDADFYDGNGECVRRTWIGEPEDKTNV